MHQKQFCCFGTFENLGNLCINSVFVCVVENVRAIVMSPCAITSSLSPMCSLNRNEEQERKERRKKTVCGDVDRILLVQYGML